jgi:hypothetical protein
MFITVELVEDFEISFYHKRSCDYYAKLEFYVDDKFVQEWRGNNSTPTEWEQYTHLLTKGTHTLKWTYNKRVADAKADDCVFLDNIVLPPFNIIAFVSPATNLKAEVDASNITLTWNASPNAMEYVIMRNDEQIATVEETTYTDIVNQKGTYTYSVIAKKYDAVSEAVSVTVEVTELSIDDINTKPEDYVFEHENTIDNPISVIIKGRNQGTYEDLYYRVSLIDSEGNQIMIRRNHAYTLHITGKLSHGSKTFEEALSAPFSNNIWISIDSWVTEIEDEKYRMSVGTTGVVLDAERAGSKYTLRYTLKRIDGGTLSQDDKPDVSWLGSNNVAAHNFTHNFDTSTGNGEIIINLNPLHNDIQEGMLLIKKGKLQRTIEVNVIKPQKFIPSWVGTQIYGGATGEFVTLKFTIPESCPDILYPFPVLISVNTLDVRASSGMTLPVIRKGEDGWFGEDYPGIEYKYEYIVTEPGPQRIYFKNILTFSEGTTENIHIEAKHFESLTKTFSFANHQRAIMTDGLNEYHPSGYDGEFSQDELVYYALVAPKKNALISFHLKLIDKTSGKSINAGPNDEFLLYSKTLDYLQDGEEGSVGVNQFECKFYPVDEAYWNTSSNGRVMMFMPRNHIATNTGH